MFLNYIKKLPLSSSVKMLAVYGTFIIIHILMNNLSISTAYNASQYIGLLQELLIITILINIIFIINIKVLRNILIFTLLAIYATVFVLQEFSLNISGDIINLVSLNNAGQALLLLNFNIILKAITFLIIFIVILWLVLHIKPSSKIKSLTNIILLVVIYVLGLQYKHHYCKCRQSFLPIKQFYEVVKLYKKSSERILTHELTTKDLSVAEHYNIHIDINADKPFEKEEIYHSNLEHLNANKQKPNIIIFFIESLSSRLLGAYKKEMTEVTPNINDFAKKSTVVKGYYNHATPTAPGLYGQNCSLYPLLTFSDMDATPNILSSIKLKCMADYAVENDYNSTYFSHSRGYHTHFDEDFVHWGYDNTCFWRDFSKKFLHTDHVILGENGPSDHQMILGLTNFLKNAKSTKPIFLSVSTIETHVGLQTNPEDGIRYKNGDSETLNLVHNYDDAFGIFWKYFKSSKYAKNTIVILTGDHALYPNTDYKKVAGQEWIASVYDELSLIIYDPIHILPKQLNVNATSVDLAPTVLQLLDIDPHQKNSFMGISIFDKKEHNSSFAISAYSDFNFYLNDNGVVTNKKIMDVQDKNIQSEYESLLHVLEYASYLRFKNKW